MKKLLSFLKILLILILIVNLTSAQELAPLSQLNNSNISNIILPSQQLETGDILETIQLINDRDPLGVTIINSTIYITSSDGSGNNYWDKYQLDGTYLGSVVQGTTSSYGYRDLAYDGTNILASDDNDIDKIDPNTFAIVSTITNTENNPHRGLAYDPNEDVIYITNYRFHPLIKIDAATGALIKELNKPTENVYGIAFDRFSYPDYASLWYAEPSSYGEFRISRVDTTFGNINFSYDISSELSDSSLSGGLEIINDHPNYPDKIIAVAVEQKSRKLIFIDITNAPEIMPGTLTEVSEFGGWDAEGLITYGMVQYSDYLYSINYDDNSKTSDLWIYDISTDPETPSFVKTIAVGGANKIFLHNDLLFISNGTPNPNSFSIYQLSDPLNPTFKSTFDTGNQILDMEFDGDYAFVIQMNIPQMTVYNISDLGNPQQHDIYDLLSPCSDLAINNSRKILFISYNSGWVSNNGIELVDISNMNTIQQLDNGSTNTGQTQRMAVIDDDYLAVITNSINNDECKINIYNYSNNTDIIFIDLHYLSWDNGGWDLIKMDDILIVTIKGEGIQTLSWSAATQTFLFGPTLAQLEPLNLTSYIPPTGSRANIKRNYNSTMFSAAEAYLYETIGLASGYYANGSLPNKVIQVRKPRYNVTEKVTLEMSVSPSEAATAGCSTTPSPGAYEYDLNTSVNISAIEADGWIFDYWLSASGGINTSILMDEYKNVTAVFKIVEPEKVILSMSISPAQAALDGCSTTPAVGSHDYDPNTTVDLSAHEANGWVFNDWQGVSGGNPTSIVMDVDKAVVALFQPTLTVSGNNKKVISCISDQKDSLRELGTINFCASEADDWVLNGFTLAGSGTGDEVSHIQSVFVTLGDAAALEPFGGDNGTVTLTFNNPITIPKGNCINIEILYYMNEISEEDILNNSSLDFHYKTTLINAFPANYTPGLIMGDAENEIFILAKVYNDDMEIFPTIQEAIDNTNNSLDFEDLNKIYVCCGDYEESLNINKIAVLEAVESEDNSSNIISDGIDNVLMNISGEGVFFDNFRFSSKNTNGSYSFRNSNLIQFDDCSFSMSENHKLVFDINDVSRTEFNNCNMFGGKKIIKARGGGELNLKYFDFNPGRLDNPTEEWSIDVSNYRYININNMHSDYGINSIFNNININVENSDSCLISSFSPPSPQSYESLNRIRLVNAPNSKLSFVEDVSLEMINSNDSKIEYSDFYSINVINSSNVTIENNDFGKDQFGTYRMPKYGVSLIKSDIFGSGSTPMTNVRLINNVFKFVLNGIYALNQSNLRVLKNKGEPGLDIFCDGGTNLDILFNEISFGVGVMIKDAEYIHVQRNIIEHASTGITISGTNYGYVTGNDLKYNFENISINSSNYLNVRQNNILDASGNNTGVFINNSVGLNLLNNNILNNNGAGIHVSGESHVVLNQNNISGNTGAEVENDGTGFVDAQNNFWENASGPEPNDIVGNVDATNWLQEPMGLVATPEQDTLYFTMGEEDSISIFTNNISDYNDIYNVTITQTQDWINNETEYNNVQADSNGTVIKLKIRIPEESSEFNKITVNLISQTNEKTATTDFYVLPYLIELKDIYISPDSISIALGDSLRFNAVGIDQYGNAISLSPQWSTDNGIIDNTGLYKASDTTGSTTITATESGLTGISELLVTNTTPVLNNITLEPDSIKLKFGESYQFSYSSNDQFGNAIMFYPIWTATGGTISNTGIYVADSTNGIYFVKLEDSETNLLDSSVVIVNAALVLSSINLEPDSIKLQFGESYQFTFSSTDQFGDSIMFHQVWSATGGTISDEGLYRADSTIGTYFVKLVAAESSLFDSSIVIIDNLVSVEEIIPVEFSLAQNYPNPFNPSTTINFGLKEEGYVALSIFNILGERVALPVNKKMNAGLHSVNVNFGNLASGIYIYRIDVKGKFADVKKMLLLR